MVSGPLVIHVGKKRVDLHLVSFKSCLKTTSKHQFQVNFRPKSEKQNNKASKGSMAYLRDLEVQAMKGKADMLPFIRTEDLYPLKDSHPGYTEKRTHINQQGKHK